jgi:hypothetical protein
MTFTIEIKGDIEITVCPKTSEREKLTDNQIKDIFIDVFNLSHVHPHYRCEDC